MQKQIIEYISNKFTKNDYMLFVRDLLHSDKPLTKSQCLDFVSANVNDENFMMQLFAFGKDHKHVVLSYLTQKIHSQMIYVTILSLT